MRLFAPGPLLMVCVVAWTGLSPSRVFADTRSFPHTEDVRQGVGYRLALKAPGSGAAGVVEEKPPSNTRVPKQPVAPEKDGPPPLQPYQPSEQIPADQAVDFPADI